MRILIVGNGGREHALLWKLRRDDPRAELYATRPNGGMAPHCRAVDLAPDDVEAVAAWAERERIDLTVIGPEAPLAEGLADRLIARGLPVFGPTAAAARIEASKAYAKRLMDRAGVPTASHRTFRSAAAARSWIEERGAPIVVKASGLAAGKGAVVCGTVHEALGAVDAMLADGAYGPAGDEVVIEECMEGEEVSLFAITDGEDCVLLEAAQDHKRVGEGDTGPNTGGMGAYAPVAIADEALLAEARDRILRPTLRALAEDGARFRGVLYAGLMKTADGLRVVEFNCRLGDPEAQVVLPLLDSSFLELAATVANGGRVRDVALRSAPDAAVTTVVAAAGYPGPYEKGRDISIPDDLEGDGVLVFHGGTRLDGSRLLTAGGRVLAVTARGASVAEAAGASRSAAERIRFEGAFFRRDIGWRERARQSVG